jgi:DNA-binding winged helix-turn-helix (wHTH) protein
MSSFFTACHLPPLLAGALGAGLNHFEGLFDAAGSVLGRWRKFFEGHEELADDQLRRPEGPHLVSHPRDILHGFGGKALERVLAEADHKGHIRLDALAIEEIAFHELEADLDASEPSKRVFRFGDLELDATTGELSRDGQWVRLQPQQLQLLAVLLRHPGHVVSRDELKQALWSEQTFVEFEDSLNHAVIRLRRALGDSAEEPRFIETVPKRGYRFVAAVESRSPSQLASEPAVSQKGARVALVVLASVALVGTAVLAWRLDSRGRERTQRWSRGEQVAESGEDAERE